MFPCGRNPAAATARRARSAGRCGIAGPASPARPCAAGDDGCRLGVQAVHHGGLHVQLAADGVRDEVCVDEDGVGRDEGCFVLEEEGGGNLGVLGVSVSHEGHVFVVVGQ